MLRRLEEAGFRPHRLTGVPSPLRGNCSSLLHFSVIFLMQNNVKSKKNIHINVSIVKKYLKDRNIFVIFVFDESVDKNVLSNISNHSRLSSKIILKVESLLGLKDPQKSL